MPDCTSRKNDHIWFKVKKVSAILATDLKKSRIIKTLEGFIKANKGDYLCKGIEGEQWAIKKEDLERRYKPTGKNDGKWIEYKPQTDVSDLWARELERETKIDTEFGKLSGGKEDYLIIETNIKTKENICYWIVKKSIFLKTYKTI